MKNRILLLRLDAIGDFVLFTSVLPYLRKRFEGAFISLAVHPLVAPLAEGFSYVDEVWSIDPQRYAADLGYAQEIAVKLNGNVDVAINTMYTRTAVSDNVIARTHAPVKIGYECIDKDGEEQRRQREQVLYTHLIETSKEWMFEIDRHRTLLDYLGIDSLGLQLKPELWIQAEEQKAVEDFVKSKLSKNPKFVVMSVGGGFPIKLWSPDSFARVADLLVEKFGLQVLLGGTVQEKTIVESVMSRMRNAAVDVTGIFGIRQFVSLIDRSVLFFGNDTAGFHIAWSLGRPAVGIFGGGHFGRFTPSLPHVRVVHVPMDCYNCYWHCIYDEVKCITSITPEMVMAEVEQVLNLESVARK